MCSPWTIHYMKGPYFEKCYSVSVPHNWYSLMNGVSSPLIRSCVWCKPENGSIMIKMPDEWKNELDLLPQIFKIHCTEVDNHWQRQRDAEEEAARVLALEKKRAAEEAARKRAEEEEAARKRAEAEAAAQAKAQAEAEAAAARQREAEAKAQADAKADGDVATHAPDMLDFVIAQAMNLGRNHDRDSTQVQTFLAHVIGNKKPESKVADIDGSDTEDDSNFNKPKGGDAPQQTGLGMTLRPRNNKGLVESLTAPPQSHIADTMATMLQEQQDMKIAASSDDNPSSFLLTRDKMEKNDAESKQLKPDGDVNQEDVPIVQSKKRKTRNDKITSPHLSFPRGSVDAAVETYISMRLKMVEQMDCVDFLQMLLDQEKLEGKVKCIFDDPGWNVMTNKSRQAEGAEFLLTDTLTTVQKKEYLRRSHKLLRDDGIVLIQTHLTDLGFWQLAVRQLRNAAQNGDDDGCNFYVPVNSVIMVCPQLTKGYQPAEGTMLDTGGFVVFMLFKTRAGVDHLRTNRKGMWNSKYYAGHRQSIYDPAVTMYRRPNPKIALYDVNGKPWRIQEKNPAFMAMLLDSYTDPWDIVVEAHCGTMSTAVANCCMLYPRVLYCNDLCPNKHGVATGESKMNQSSMIHDGYSRLRFLVQAWSTLGFVNTKTHVLRHDITFRALMEPLMDARTHLSPAAYLDALVPLEQGVIKPSKNFKDTSEIGDISSTLLKMQYESEHDDVVMPDVVESEANSNEELIQTEEFQQQLADAKKEALADDQALSAEVAADEETQAEMNALGVRSVRQVVEEIKILNEANDAIKFWYGPNASHFVKMKMLNNVNVMPVIQEEIVNLERERNEWAKFFGVVIRRSDLGTLTGNANELGVYLQHNGDMNKTGLCFWGHVYNKIALINEFGVEGIKNIRNSVKLNSQYTLIPDPRCPAGYVNHMRRDDAISHAFKLELQLDTSVLTDIQRAITIKSVRLVPSSGR